MPNIIILDKDGTVLDSSEATLEGFIQTLQGYTTRERVVEVINRTLGHPPDEQYGIILSLPKDDPLVSECVEALWENLKNLKPKVYEDALDVIPELANDGYTLVLSTGYRPDIAHAQLEMVGLRRHFDLILGHNPPITKGEPHMKEVMEKYGISLEEMSEVSIVGDGVGDIRMGQGYTQRLYGIDRIGNSKELIESGALKVFPNLIEFYQHFKS